MTQGIFKGFKFAIAFSLVWALCTSVWSQALSRDPQPVTQPHSEQPTVSQALSPEPQAPASRKPSDKVPASAIQKIKEGPLDLYIEFEHQDIIEKEKNKRAAKGLAANDEQIERETRREFKQLRESIFPNGGLAGVTILRTSDAVPTAKVRVQNAQALDRLVANPKITAIFEDQEYVPFLAQSLPLIGQPAAQSAGKSGTGTTVAVIDNGINPWSFGCKYGNEPSYDVHYKNPVLGTPGCRVSIYQFFGPAGTQPLDFNQSNHGTIDTGIVAGVAPGSQLAFLAGGYSFQGAAAGMYWDAIEKAIVWTIENAKAYNIVALSMSFGTSPSPISPGYCPSSTRYWTYFERLRTNNVIPVAAAGNEGNKQMLPEPACLPQAVSVGNMYDANYDSTQKWATCSDVNPRVYQVACSSNSNLTLKIIAPGSFISAVGLLNGGTSQAAPHVAGAIAVLRAPNAFPWESTEETIRRLTNSGRKVIDWKNGISTPMLDLAAALSYSPAPYGPASFSVQTIINQLLTGE